jgi:hypothetical protein
MGTVTRREQRQDGREPGEHKAQVERQAKKGKHEETPGKVHGTNRKRTNNGLRKDRARTENESKN